MTGHQSQRRRAASSDVVIRAYTRTDESERVRGKISDMANGGLTNSAATVARFLEYVGSKKPERLLLNALDEKSVSQALKEMRDNSEFQGLKEMALVVRREEKIAKFKSVPHYAIKAIFANGAGGIPATWQVTTLKVKIFSSPLVAIAS